MNDKKVLTQYDGEVVIKGRRCIRVLMESDGIQSQLLVPRDVIPQFGEELENLVLRLAVELLDR